MLICNHGNAEPLTYIPTSSKYQQRPEKGKGFREGAVNRGRHEKRFGSKELVNKMSKIGSKVLPVLSSRIINKRHLPK